MSLNYVYEFSNSQKKFHIESFCYMLSAKEQSSSHETKGVQSNTVGAHRCSNILQLYTK